MNIRPPASCCPATQVRHRHVPHRPVFRPLGRLQAAARRRRFSGWAVAVLAMMGGPPVLAGGFDRAIETAVPRVVKLYGLGAGTQAGYGTGVIVSADGLVLTVFSLLIDARHIRAVTSDGTVYEADVVHRDPLRQLALLRLKRPAPGHAEGEGAAAPAESPIGPFPYFDLTCELLSTASPTAAGPCLPTLQPGDWVLAAGNPFKVAEGREPVSVAHGVFSTRTRLDARRKVKDFPYRGDVLVIDAVTSNPGAPGSALVDLDGRFLGMIGRVVMSNLTHTHFNYAVPKDVLFEYFQEASNPLPGEPGAPPETSARRAAPRSAAEVVDIGVRIARTGYRQIPPFVERVRADSPAAQAGVRKDDLIMSVNGKNVADVTEFDERWAELRPGEPIDLVIRRGRNILNLRIAAEKQP